jgi:metallophosphoesterase superfamily enzyme
MPMRRIVGIFDVHIPDHDVEAFQAVKDFLVDYQPDTLIIGGDFGELESCSSHGGVIEPPMIYQDVAEMRMELTDLRDVVGEDCRMVYIEGNHETRLKRIVANKLPQAAFSLSLPKMLNLADLNIEWLPEGQLLSIGNLNFVHGKWASLHHAKKHMEAYMHNIIFGHTHKPQMFVKGLPGAKYMAGCGSPTLRDLDAGYLNGYPSGWAQGFVVCEVDEEAQLSNVYTVLMDEQRFVFNGKLYGGKDANSDKHK